MGKYLMDFLSQDEFRKLATADPPENTAVRYAPNPSLPTQMGETQSRVFRFCFSDGEVDQMGDTLNPKGWILDDFLANPVALWSHSYESPIGRASNLKVEGKRLMGDIEFATADVCPLADEIFRLVQAGFVRAVSVGFIPVEYEFSKDKERPYGVNYNQQKLIEISICSVPANPRALLEQAKALGIEVKNLNLLYKPAETLLTVNKPSEEELLMSLKSVLKQTERELSRIKKESEGVVDMDMDENDPTDSHELSLRMAHMHAKAMMYHHKECMKHLSKAIDDIGDEHPDDEDDKAEGDDDHDGDNDDDKPEEKAQRIRARVNLAAKV